MHRTNSLRDVDFSPTGRFLAERLMQTCRRTALTPERALRSPMLDSGTPAQKQEVAIRGEDLVESGSWPDDAVAAYVTFPKPEATLSAVPLRHVAYCLLIRLADSTIWFLRTRGTPWLSARIAHAARTIASERGAREAPEQLALRIAYELEISSVEVLPPVLDRVEPSLWQPRQVAIALAMCPAPRLRADIDLGALSSATTNITRELSVALQVALDAFCTGLNAEALPESTIAGELDPARYNFFVQTPMGEWRLQLARTFPILVYAATEARGGSEGETVRAAIDCGKPLIRHLAAHWDVAPGAIRSLIGKPVETIGCVWNHNVRGLVRLLDALRPEDRPGEPKEEWNRFNSAVAAAERLFRLRPWTSPVALMWLREAARNGLTREEDEVGPLWGPASVASIQRFRNNLARAIELQYTRQSRSMQIEVRAAISWIADRFVASRRPRSVVAFAKRLDSCMSNVREERRKDLSLLSGDSFWPLLSSELVSTDGTRRVCPLVTREALRAEGRALEICIGENAEQYTAECTSGKVFILGIVEAVSGDARSTAEIYASRTLRGRLDLLVVQHRSRRNGTPSPLCIRALQEALAHARSASGQEHLEAGMAIARRLGDLGHVGAKREAEWILLAEAFAQTLGVAAWETILSDAASALSRQVPYLPTTTNERGPE